MKLIGRAPNFSWSASDFDDSCVKLPVICGSSVGDRAVHLGRGEHRAVEHERELVAGRLAVQAEQAGADGAEVLGALLVELDVHGPLAGAGAGLRGDHAVRRVDDVLAARLDRAEQVLRRATDVAGDERLIGGRHVGRGLVEARAVEVVELVLEGRGDPRRVAAVGRLGGRRGLELLGRLGGRRGLGRVDRLVRRGIREQHGAQLELGRRLDAVARLVVELARDADDDVGALGVDLGLGDARRVDALADDRDGLVELLLGDGLAGLDLGLEDDLRAALEVERELRGPGTAAPDHAGRVDREESDDDDAEPGEGSPGLANGGRPG